MKREYKKYKDVGNLYKYRIYTKIYKVWINVGKMHTLKFITNFKSLFC